ncbi:MAG: hypothetical protein GFH27_549301n54 [Chloroflexi bacterium AL-W]|nr:hypothetical protein [Chloroflexi bacterium AL-N1]NOK68247.1 hypothetical protein [Chloroflexi bacterium AL-N10]NOK73893.1 hypothetical protein [Chloroflexi bacterium AL-N5]NOK82861.1 hypothetical protein [Chloroflexi bacterium AL-W]NOK90383.1 hypothetical protein [Chloroflexi bacterium AL-N15]
MIYNFFDSNDDCPLHGPCIDECDKCDDDDDYDDDW